MEAGSVFGDLALLFPTRERQATVTAATPLHVLTLTWPAYEELLHAYPEVRKIFADTARAMLLQKFLHVNVLYRLNFRDPRRERLFLASSAFFVTFAGVRYIVHSIRAGRGPFRNVSAGNKHIHHLVWGILLLLVVGYAWLVQLGTGVGDPPRRWMRSTALLYGAGSALTLDEFALWLNLEDVYWAPEGRRSIDAVILFGAMLSVGFWGGPFFRALYRFFFPQQHARLQQRLHV
jgi:hypothetical protein